MKVNCEATAARLRGLLFLLTVLWVHAPTTLRFRPQPARLPPVLILVAGASVLQQLVEDAGLFQGSEAGNVLRNNWNICTVICFITFVFITVG